MQLLVLQCRKPFLETLSAPASEGRVSMGIPMFSHVMIYEKVGVCQGVGVISVGFPRTGLQRSVYLGKQKNSLDTHILCNDFWASAAT